MNTAEQTVRYIDEHPYIKHCLQYDLINYSALARQIAKDLKLTNKTSLEAILVAARRYREKLGVATFSSAVHEVLVESEIEIKNKMHVFITKKSVDFDALDALQKVIRKQSGLSYVLEGSDHYTLIFQQKHLTDFSNLCNGKILLHHDAFVLIRLKSPDSIEKTHGVMAYLTSLFAQNGVNIYEMISCWKDTLLLVESRDVSKVLGFLQF